MTAEMVPRFLQNEDGGVYPFCTQLVQAVSQFACAIKINHAHFAAAGIEDQLKRLIALLHSDYPSIPVILDAKRGDIGATAEHYAAEAFLRFGADAVTVNPYLGWDTLEPFLQHNDRGVIVLCKTSNPGSDWLQDWPPENPSYLRIAERVQREENSNLMLVVGATYPSSLARVREVAPDVTILVPGVGAQGGSAQRVLKAGGRSDGWGLLINCSRSIIQQDSDAKHYFDLVAESARAYHQQFAHTLEARTSEQSLNSS